MRNPRNRAGFLFTGPEPARSVSPGPGASAGEAYCLVLMVLASGLITFGIT